MARPREYDEAALLAHAMDSFWSRGYRGTSIDELVSETGVSRASLYNAYPDKQGLFIESIRHYLDEIVENNVRRLNEVEPASEAVRQFFLNLVDAPLAKLRRGCLLTNTAAELGLQDRQTAALIRRALTRVENALYQRLVEAREAGDVVEGVDLRGYARQLMTVLQGIRVMARVDVGRAMMKDAVKAALSPIKPSRAVRGASTLKARSRLGASKKRVR